jgi:hypothetical protein
VIPTRREQNLLVATWNLRAFADLTQKWHAGPKDSPQRDWHAVACVAQIVSRFDLVAIQEIRRNTAAARFLLQRLGPDWRMIISDVTEGDAGNGERLSFFYRHDRVQPSGLVGETVLPPGPSGDPARQFARGPTPPASPAREPSSSSPPCTSSGGANPRTGCRTSASVRHCRLGRCRSG